MRRKGAAPEGRLAASPSGNGFNWEQHNSAAAAGAKQARRAAPQIQPNPFDDAVIARRLAEHNVRSVADWKGLGRARLALFGVPPRLIAALDALARAAK
jgi:hypothetical protein